MRAFKLLCVLAAAGLCSCNGDKSDDPIKVISYNIRYGTADDGENSWHLRRGATLEILDREKPDLVGMQEVMAQQYDFIAENATDYGIVGVGRDDGQRSGEMMAVMYRKGRFEKLEEGHFWLSETPGEVSLGWDGACNRMVTWVFLQDRLSGRNLYFFNTHLDHVGPVARREGSDLVARRISEITGNAPFILTGDFNALPDDDVLAGIRNEFASARDKAPVTDSKGTFNGLGSARDDQVIDHIYYRGLEPSLFRTLDGNYGAPYISDHYPVEAVFYYRD